MTPVVSTGLVLFLSASLGLIVAVLLLIKKRRDVGIIAICSLLNVSGTMLSNHVPWGAHWHWTYWVQITIGLVALCKYIYLSLLKPEAV